MALLNRSRWLLPSTRIHSRDCLLRSFSATNPKFGAAGATGSSPPGNSPSGSRRFRQHVNPLSMVYRQPVELPDWTECFADASLPIHLDIGCARGRYLVDVAASQAAQRNFVGVEIRRNVLQEAEREAERHGLKNLAFVHANMNIHQATLLQSLPAPVESVSIFHPDPWMKKRHIKRRLVTEEFVEEMAELLPNGTPIYVQTDVEELFAYMVEVFELSRLYDFDALHENPLGIPTDREKFVFNEGGEIYRVKFIVDKPVEVAKEEVAPTAPDA
ncbi:hypothetical protein PR003_g2627 [Phytophthora rubi]|uniref:tRNA (guanine(46)-N(7))-methyltransferase n=1 Tax=Phytophthora rubi TaxID=129364 RepID=A0A6A4G0Q1_9STRA|nr:hypothetical protein PR002_g2412 [Phytophthora rubi]KAE9049780.1 hypothetical protein PR001_g3007 [Phytophthora rubi]KAE9355858.1 hypothetical protein PR003_g2627 [Phytophthora rubi]